MFCVTLYLKISNTFLLNDICILLVVNWDLIQMDSRKYFSHMARIHGFFQNSSWRIQMDSRTWLQISAPTISNRVKAQMVNFFFFFFFFFLFGRDTWVCSGYWNQPRHRAWAHVDCKGRDQCTATGRLETMVCKTYKVISSQRNLVL